MQPQITQVNISPGGMPKRPVLLARLTFACFDGDRQRNRTHHGGPGRAVCLYSEELYSLARADGIGISAGEIGENVTTKGLDLLTCRPGDQLSLGPEAIIELTETRTPCRQLNQWDQRLFNWLKGRSGWLARVIREGHVRPGDALALVPYRQPEGDQI